MAKAIMVQGTMSNAGKSVLVAALCRIFKEDGFKVVPFKSQNMALNSFITKEGLEMGRAQVAQAEAAGVEPSVLMNPILLKPTNDTSSQVIVNGEVWNNMSAKEYYKNKKVLVPQVEKAFNKLSEENDIIVIEGAGSPAEINLKENDIVNMFMAKMAKAPVLLVGDIDRGGVFASLVGTMMLFDDEEKEIVKGLVINKFRGDETILAPGLKTLEDMTGKPVVGVVPYLDVDIDDEDSLTERFTAKNQPALIDLVVIRTPRISNFTDFSVFESIEGVRVRYVKNVEELGNPDMIFLPGTKNTMEDLLWLRQNGIEAKIKKMAAAGTPVFGICGGYQMLGEVLNDPHGIEHGGTVAGMALIPTETTFEKEKVRTRVEGEIFGAQGIFQGLNGLSIEGYEIHMGTSKIKEGSKLVKLKSLDGVEKEDGVSNGNVYGSYVHGFFDKEGIANEIVSALLRKKGLDDTKAKSINVEEYKESQYVKLAQGVRKALDMDKIYEIMDLKPKRGK